MAVKMKAVFWDVQMLTLLNRLYKLLTEDAVRLRWSSG